MVGSSAYAIEVTAGYIVTGNSADAILDADWDQFLGAVKSVGADTQQVNVLVYAAGAGPNAMQRARMNIVAKSHAIRIAVVTESAVARAAIMAVGWTARVSAKGFSPTDIEGAFNYLGVPNPMRPRLQASLNSVRASIGDS
jgi:hypothetical protein